MLCQEAERILAMVSTTTKASNISPETTLAEQRVVFHNISWQANLEILAALGEVQQQVQS